MDGVPGQVYNLTPSTFTRGDKILKSVLGGIAPRQFDKYHRWVNGEYMLEKCKVGVLDTYVPGSDSEDSEEEDEEEEDDFTFRPWRARASAREHAFRAEMRATFGTHRFVF